MEDSEEDSNKRKWSEEDSIEQESPQNTTPSGSQSSLAALISSLPFANEFMPLLLNNGGTRESAPSNFVKRRRLSAGTPQGILLLLNDKKFSEAYISFQT